MIRASLTLLTTLLFTAGASAAPMTRTAFLNSIKHAASCEKTYEITSSLVSYSAQSEPNRARAQKITQLADRMEAKQHAIEKVVDGSKNEAVQLGISEALFYKTIGQYRANAEVEAAFMIQQLDESQYGQIIQQTDQACDPYTRSLMR